MGECQKCARDGGFTLIELSIVLVIIGLVVGGVLVGQDLVRAAGVRATISQIERFKTAANTFREKYGYLPGDIKDPDASSFGFQARGQYAGEGDGNGAIEGVSGDAAAHNYGNCEAAGETVMFWVDLSTVRLIDGGFKAGHPNGGVAGVVTFTSSPSIDAFLPTAKLGSGNYIYVWSGNTQHGVNFLSFSGVTSINNGNCGVTSAPSLSVREANAIDTKMDDGLPARGNVTASYLSGTSWPAYASGGGNVVYFSTSPTPGSSTTCFDNNGVSGADLRYSMTQSGGAGINCALSFQF